MACLSRRIASLYLIHDVRVWRSSLPGGVLRAAQLCCSLPSGLLTCDLKKRAAVSAHSHTEYLRDFELVESRRRCETPKILPKRIRLYHIWHYHTQWTNKQTRRSTFLFLSFFMRKNEHLDIGCQGFLSTVWFLKNILAVLLNTPYDLMFHSCLKRKRC